MLVKTGLDETGTETGGSTVGAQPGIPAHGRRGHVHRTTSAFALHGPTRETSMYEPP